MGDSFAGFAAIVFVGDVAFEKFKAGIVHEGFQIPGEPIAEVVDDPYSRGSMVHEVFYNIGTDETCASAYKHMGLLQLVVVVAARV